MRQQSHVRGLLLRVILFSQRLLTYICSKTCRDFPVAARTRGKNLLKVKPLPISNIAKKRGYIVKNPFSSKTRFSCR